jgi:hypothetical protein
MHASRTFVVLAVAAIALGACSSSGATAAPAAPASVAAANTPAPAASAQPSTPAPASAMPTLAMTEPPAGASLPLANIDPCTLLTDQEASQLAGATLPAGKGSVAGSQRLCVRAATGLPPSSITVGVIDASSVSQAEIAYNEAYLNLKATTAGLHPTPVTGIGDQAETISASMSVQGVTASIAAIYVRKGGIFFDIVFEGVGAGPGMSALESAASTAVGRLP